MLLLRANSAAYGRQRAGGAEHAGGGRVVAALYVLDEARYVDIHGTALNALRIRTVEASGSLHAGLIGRQALVYFFVGVDAVGGIKHGHLCPRNGGALLGAEGVAQVGTPLCIAR